MTKNWRKMTKVFECWSKKHVFWVIQEAYVLDFFSDFFFKFQQKILNRPQKSIFIAFLNNGKLFPKENRYKDMYLIKNNEKDITENLSQDTRN